MSDEATSQTPAPFESASELRKTHACLLEELDSYLEQDASTAGEVAALTRLAPEIRQFLERGAATGVFLDETRERTACQVLLDYWLSSLAQAGLPTALAVGSARLSRFDDKQLPDLKDKLCPYVGLEAFQAQDQAFFFGRESDTQALLALVATAPLVVVLGASGSGKSSLVMGGVLPALAAGGSPPALRIVPPFSPGNDVLRHLIDATQSRRDAGTIATPDPAALRADPQTLLALVGGAEAPPTLITIDQFEEVFTLSSAEDREALVASLAQMLKSDRGHRVILTVREEFRSRIVQLRPLSPYLDAAWYSMRPLDYDELRAAVEKPATLVNLQFQVGIVDDLVKKVLGQPAALPLLQFTLRRLWETRDRNRITREVYGETGDPLTALRDSADHFYDGLALETQTEVRRVLLELVRVDELLEAYRQPVPMSRLLAAGKANTKEVLALLAEKDYVRITVETSAADAVVEVKHESLVRNWPRFVAWIDEKRVERRRRLSLSEAARRWAEGGKPVAGLLTGLQLEEAKGHSNLSSLEEELVRASAEAVEHARREREEARRQREEALRREAEQATALVESKRKLLRWTRALLIFAVVVAGATTWAAILYRQKAGKLRQDKGKLVVDARILNDRTRQLEAQHQETARKLVASDTAYTHLYNYLFSLGVRRTVAPVNPQRPNELVTISLHISKEEQLTRAKEIARLLEGNGIKVPSVERASAVTRSEVRYSRAKDKSEAEGIAKLLNDYLAAEAPIKPRLFTGSEQRVPGERYEIWFAPDALGTDATATQPPVPPAPQPEPSVVPTTAPAQIPTVSGATVVLQTTDDDKDEGAYVTIGIRTGIRTDVGKVFTWRETRSTDWNRGFKTIQLTRVDDLALSAFDDARIRVCMARAAEHGWQFDYTGKLVIGNEPALTFGHQGNTIARGLGLGCVDCPLREAAAGTRADARPRPCFYVSSLQ